MMYLYVVIVTLIYADGLRLSSASTMNQNKYYLYSFGKGSIRRLWPEIFDSVEVAKTAAYRIYSNEIARIKKAVDYLVAKDSY